MSLRNDHHALSMAALMDENSPNSMKAALEWEFPREISEPGRPKLIVECTARFATAPSWSSRRPAAWIREMTLDISLIRENHTESSSLTIELPWICDALTQHFASGFSDGVAVGNHDGLFFGKPLVPLTLNVRKPGIWLEQRTGGPMRVVIPEFGPVVNLGWVRGKPAISIKTSELRPFDDLTDAELGWYKRLLFARGQSRLVMSVAQWQDLVETWMDLDLLREGRTGEFEQLVPRDLDPSFRVAETASVRRQLRPFGDVLRRAIVGGLNGAISTWTSKGRLVEPADGTYWTAQRLSQVLRPRLDKDIERLVTPGKWNANDENESSSVSRAEDDRSTLGRLELRRVVTQRGPSGTPSLRSHRAWLRSLHPDFRGRLCPVLSTESSDLGLVRGLSLGAALAGNGELSTDEGVIESLNGSSGLHELSASASLIPFINHDDPSRAFMGAKSLRQAVPIKSPEAPLVRSGSERLLAEFGVVRSPMAGTVVEEDDDAVLIEDFEGTHRVGIGPGAPSQWKVGARWRRVVPLEDDVEQGDILAAAPDVVIDESGPILALGANVMTALTPWYGWNFEDGIVVSESMAQRFASEHRLSWKETLRGWRREHGEEIGREVWIPDHDIGTEVKAGTIIGYIEGSGGSRRPVKSPEAGSLQRCDPDRDAVHFEIIVHRPLVVGDKLTTRHGGKGVVSRVVADGEMPLMPQGERVDMILNPLSIGRRVAIGQFLEIHQGLLQHLSGEGPAVVGRRCNSVDELLTQLDRRGATGGRLPLTVKGQPLGTEEGIVVGPIYVVKLDHHATDKARARGSGRISRTTGQPAKSTEWHGGSRIGAAQRLGEMEMWSFSAVGASGLIRDAQRRSDRGDGSLESARAHLAVAGIVIKDEVPAENELTRSYSYRATWDDLEDYSPDFPQRTNRHAPGWANPLHDNEHGSEESHVSCECGKPTRPGHRCERCGIRAQRRPSGERSRFKFKISLATAVPHPWKPGDGIEQPTISHIPLLPPAYRMERFEKLDRAYERLIKVNKEIEDRQARVQARGDTEPPIDDVDRKRLEAAVVDLLGRLDNPRNGTIAARLCGKTGLLRRSLRGRNADWSARLVVAPDPTLEIDEVGLPALALESLGISTPDETDGSAGYGDIVFVNRPPTLRPYAMVALRVRPTEGYAARIHPYLCGLIAGDFDGDELNIHRPLQKEHRGEAWNLLSPHVFVRSAADGKLLGSFEHEVALGLVLGQLEDPDSYTGDQPLQHFKEIHTQACEAATGFSLSALDFRDQTESFTTAASAGVIGKQSSIAQIRDRRGVAGFDFYGEPAPDIESNFLSGLDNDEYFASAPIGLRNISDKKLVTPHAGGTTKSLVEAAYDIVIAEGRCSGERDDRLPVLLCSAVPHEICQECFGNQPGNQHPPAAGAHAGLFAALMIGERTTQQAMKAHGQAGANQAVGDRIRPLNALFGHGTATISKGGEERKIGRVVEILRHLNAGHQSRDKTIESLCELRDHFARELSVDGRHIEVIWRRLYDTGQPLTFHEAQEVGDPLINATSRGNLKKLVGLCFYRHHQNQGPIDVPVPGTYRSLVISGDQRMRGR